ncbi:hypothetical protein [Mycolicibacterium mengxianglii]|uniref:hypothetical protein n=1 Tax=Mycolicibacterium mengxianglii TaxID=2736649 RepID=UPI0018D14C9E|nr:hypothetical protein [Mycolicibacterium mengxianglii]
MTPAEDACTPQLHTAIQLMRGVIAGVGCGVPAAALSDRALADWVRSHGVTVVADDHAELDLLQHNGIKPLQVVFRCGSDTAALRRAVNLGVSRFIVDTSRQMARLAECNPCTKYIYLDGDAPLVLGDRRLRVIGLHGDVDDGGAVEWATVAERLLCRSALLKTCGSPIRRITLSGGSIQIWEPGQAAVLTSITSAVDEALREGCLRWHLSRPAVSLSPSRANVTAAASHPNRRRASNIAPTLML